MAASDVFTSNAALRGVPPLGKSLLLLGRIGTARPDLTLREPFGKRFRRNVAGRCPASWLKGLLRRACSPYWWLLPRSRAPFRSGAGGAECVLGGRAGPAARAGDRGGAGQQQAEGDQHEAGARADRVGAIQHTCGAVHHPDCHGQVLLCALRWFTTRTNSGNS